MKKRFYSLMALATALFMTSCSEEQDFGALNSDNATISLNLGVEGGMATRSTTIGDGSMVNELSYAVFDENGVRINGIAKVTDKKVTSWPTTENIILAKGQTYRIAFWAQSSDCDAYTVDDNMNVTINYNDVNNDESRDAFFKTITYTVTGDGAVDVELTRPFAQMNLGVKDWDAAVASGVKITETQVVLKKAATKLDLLNGKATEPVDVVFTFAPIPTEKLMVDLDGDNVKEAYDYLSMSYILVANSETGAEKATLEDLQFIFSPENGNDFVFDQGLNSVPVQRNWRTNIIGDFLTGKITFNIAIDPIFAGDYNYPEYKVIADGVSYDKAGKTYLLSSLNGLKWFAAEANAKTTDFAGQTVKLTQDITLGATDTWTSVAFWNSEKTLTFDGNNCTIKGLNAPLFGTTTANIKNLNIADAAINATGSYQGAIAGNLYGNIENCHATDVTVETTGIRVGALVGIHNSGNMTNCSATNVSVKGLHSVAGLVGFCNESANRTYSDCNVYGAKLQVTVASGTGTKQVGAIVGAIDSSVGTLVLDSCTAENCTFIDNAGNETYAGPVNDLHGHQYSATVTIQ